MGSGAVPIVLVFLLVFFSWQTIYSANKDLVRAKAWKELARRSLPFGALLLMAASLFVVRSFEQGSVLLLWMVISGGVIILASRFSMPPTEREASKAFRSGNFQKATELYRELVEKQPLARNHAFLGAALGASERLDESITASTQAIKKDPEYGLAYYNRALVLRRQNKKDRAVKDLNKALEVDLPRRFRVAVRKLLEELA